MKVALILLAAGSGRRFGGEIPKQYVEVLGMPLICHTLHALAKEARITLVQPVISEGDDRFAAIVDRDAYPFTVLPPVTGGAERSHSMQCGFEMLPEDVDLVAVHDAARPMPSVALLADAIDVAARFGAAVPGMAVTDTIKRINSDGWVVETPERQCLRAVQTPQVARYDWFATALDREADRLHLHTDDASLLEAAGFDVHISLGEPGNRKVTTAEDIGWLEQQLRSGDQ